MVQAHGGPVRAIERVPQQGTLVASGGDDGTIRTWNPTTGAMVRDFGDGEAVLDTWRYKRGSNMEGLDVYLLI